MTEVRVMAEGALRFVQASGDSVSGTRVWATASGAETGLFGYVQSFSFTSGASRPAMMDRGQPIHWKETTRNPIDVTLNILWTGSNPLAASADGATVPQVHMEYKATEAEVAAGSARYYQFFGVNINSLQWTENAEGDTLQLTCQALAMNGPSGSGYIA